MAFTTQKVGILSQLGGELAKAHAEHKNDEANYGNPSLPPGIEGGIAQLIDMKIDLLKEGDNKGKPYFYAAGTVVQPLTHGNVKTFGLRTSITESLFPTPNAQGKRKTFADHYAFVLNQLRILGAKPETWGLDPSQVEAALLATIEHFKATKPFFYFRTQAIQDDKNPTKPPFIYQQWNGLCKVDVGAAATAEATASAIQNDTEGSSSASQETSSAYAIKETLTIDIVRAMDFTHLAALTQNGHQESQDTLIAVCRFLGIPDDVWISAQTWNDVKDTILAYLPNVAPTQSNQLPAPTAAPQQPVTPTAPPITPAVVSAPPASPSAVQTAIVANQSPPTLAAPSQPPQIAQPEQPSMEKIRIPQINEVYRYGAIDEATGQARNPTHHRVVSVDITTKTVLLQDIGTKKLVKAVPFASLVSGT